MISIKEFRADHGLTQGQLGELLQFTRSTISAVELGNRKPPRGMSTRLNELEILYADAANRNVASIRIRREKEAVLKVLEKRFKQCSKTVELAQNKLEKLCKKYSFNSDALQQAELLPDSIEKSSPTHGIFLAKEVRIVEAETHLDFCSPALQTIVELKIAALTAEKDLAFQKIKELKKELFS